MRWFFIIIYSQNDRRFEPVDGIYASSLDAALEKAVQRKSVTEDDIAKMYVKWHAASTHAEDMEAKRLFRFRTKQNRDEESLENWSLADFVAFMKLPARQPTRKV